MTTSPSTDMTTAQAIREAAWAQALALHEQWERTRSRAEGYPGGSGPISPLDAAETRRLRTVLDELVRTHGFENTRVDVLGLNWVEHRASSWACPPIDRPRCTRDTGTCPVHWARRTVGIDGHDCGYRP